MKKADGWTWEEFSLEDLSREDLRTALVGFVKAAEKGYRARTLADEVWWWDEVAGEVLKNSEGVVRLNGGGVTKRYVERYRQGGTTSYVLLYWAEGLLWAFWRRPSLRSDGSLWTVYRTLSPFSLGWKLQVPSLLERIRRLDRENRARYGADLPKGELFPVARPFGHLVLWTRAETEDAEAAEWISHGERALELPHSVKTNVKPESLARSLAKVLEVRPGPLRRLLEGRAERPEEAFLEVWEEARRQAALKNLARL